MLWVSRRWGTANATTGIGGGVYTMSVDARRRRRWGGSGELVSACRGCASGFGAWNIHHRRGVNEKAEARMT